MPRMVASLIVIAFRRGVLPRFGNPNAFGCVAGGGYRAVTSQGAALHKAYPHHDIAGAASFGATGSRSMNLFRPLLAVLAGAAVFALVIGDADARPRSSMGSRGTKTFSAPPPT